MIHNVDDAFIEDSREYATEVLELLREHLDVTYPHRPKHCEYVRFRIGQTEQYIARCNELLEQKVGQS